MKAVDLVYHIIIRAEISMHYVNNTKREEIGQFFVRPIIIGCNILGEEHKVDHNVAYSFSPGNSHHVLAQESFYMYSSSVGEIKFLALGTCTRNACV